MTIILFAAGLVFLIFGAEILVKGASRLAEGFGISRLVIGLTVVAFGTSSPELAVSIKSALAGQAGIAVGNVIGSNIFNVLFILGLSALIVPLAVSQKLVRFDVPLMIALSVLVLLFSLDGNLTRADGLMMVTGLAIYIAFLIFQSRKESARVRDVRVKELGNQERSESSRLKSILFVLCGLALLALGSRWLVEGAGAFAESMGVSELVVGLTIVSAGTSLPEVVTSIIAAVRGERDIAVGNVVGSNIFNLMGVLGVSSIIAPGGIEVSNAVTRFDLPVMIAVAFACLPIFFTDGVISRLEGVFLLAYYIVYTLYLILAAAHHDLLSRFSSVLLYFVIPLTIVTLIIVTAREIQRRKKSEPK